MRVRCFAGFGAMATLTASTLTVVQAGDWPFHRKADPNQPNTLVQIARSIDAVEDKIRDKGLIVLKHPDVWSQARMTKYRVEFETVMAAQKQNFAETLQAVVNRSDQASFQSETALAAVLTPTTRGTNGRRQAIEIDPANVTTALTVPTVNTFGAVGFGKPATLDKDGKVVPGEVTTPALQPFADPFGSNTSTAFRESLKVDGQEGKKVLGVGLEPTVVLDQQKRYLDHLNEIRRVNMGDDIADSAGYGLYLLRMPISIQPGECTYKGHGAQLSVTARPEFGANFMAESFETFVINDIVDQIGPVIYELIRDGHISYREEYSAAISAARYGLQEMQSLQVAMHSLKIQIEKAKLEAQSAKSQLGRKTDSLNEGLRAALDSTDETTRQEFQESLAVAQIYSPSEPSRARNTLTVLKDAEAKAQLDPVRAPQIDVPKNELVDALSAFDKATNSVIGKENDKEDLEKKLATLTDNLAGVRQKIMGALDRGGATLRAALVSSRVDTRTYPVSPSDLKNVFLLENLFLLAEDVDRALLHRVPRAADIRSYLRHELRSAYQIMNGRRGGVNLMSDVGFIEDVRRLLTPA